MSNILKYVDGTIGVYQIHYNTVHGLYHDIYASRHGMTDVMIQHLSLDQKIRIRCKDFIKKVSVYKDKLAVQLSDKIIIYEMNVNQETEQISYRIQEKITKNLNCNLLVVTSQHVILCQEKKLQMYNFSGEKEREWNLDTIIRYIKVTGGPIGKEGILLGLKSGHVFQVFLDNPFPILLLEQQNSIRCLDISLYRTKLAIVDDQGVCQVYDLKTRELLYSEPNANSVAWNSEFDDMLGFSGNGLLNIKVNNFPSYQQKLNGFVVGLKGSKLFCLNSHSMQTLDIPQSSNMERFIQNKDFETAYQIGCLGSTCHDWNRLGMSAMENFNIPVAKKAFIRYILIST